MTDEKKPSTREDIFSEGSIQCPYHMHKKLREEHGTEKEPAKLVWVEDKKTWYVMDKGLAEEVFINHRVFSSNISIYGHDVARNFADEHVDLMITLDGEKHAKVRKAALEAFKIKEIETKWNPRAREIVQEHLDRIIEKDSFYVVKDLGVPLPVRLICEVLGIEYDNNRIQWVRDSTEASVNFLGNAGEERFVERENAFLEKYKFELPGWIYEEIQKKKENHGDDLLTKLITKEYEIDGEKIKFDDFTIMKDVSLLLSAGNVTTTNLIGHALHYLTQYPEIWSELQEQRDSISVFVEKILKYESPVSGIYREATEDYILGGVQIKKGEQVLLALGATGRTSACPHRFDLSQSKEDHLAFGKGKHLCIGRDLARMEARVVLEEVLNTFESIKVAEDYNIEYVDWPLGRGIKELELQYTLKK